MSDRKSLVAYYSNTGSNKFLAERLAERLDAPLIPIVPKINNVPFLMTCSLIKFGPGIHDLEQDPRGFERLILVGPIWMGQLIAPLRDALSKYGDVVNEIDLVVCCGSRDEDNDGKYGYDTVFEKAREVAGPALKNCMAFPISLVLSPELQDDSDTIMKTRLTMENFKGEIVERMEAFVNRLDAHLVSV